jgi:hypothetical protein
VYRDRYEVSSDAWMKFVVRIPQILSFWILVWSRLHWALLSTGAWSAWRSKRSLQLDIDLEEDTIYG